MKFINSNVPCGTTTNACDPCGTYELEGCAAGVPYAQLVSISTGAATTRWINLDTGAVVDAKPAGFLTGACGENENSLAFSATAPTGTAPFAVPKDNYTVFVTSNGTSTGTITEMWKYDLETATWVKVPLGSAAGDLISTDASNSLITGTDGKLYVAAQALFDDDQVFTGDTTTNATVTLTPTTVPDPANATVDQVNYVVKVEVKIDGTTIVEDPVTKVLSAANQKFDVLTTAQATPTATGNTTNLNTIFTDTAGNKWAVDSNGDAVMLAAAVFKELNRFYVDSNGLDTNTGANEAPVLTVQAAVGLLGQGDVAVVNEGTYAAVTMSTANTSLVGASSAMGSLTQIASLAVTTASGTSNRVSDLTVTGNLTHSGGAPLFLHNTTVSGDVILTSAAYEEINDCRMQDGLITKTTAGTLYIKDSLIGNATFATSGTVVALDNVTIDPGDTLTIGAGVIYVLNDVRGHVVIDPGAIPAETAALAGGLSGLAAKSVETSTFNDVRLTNVPTITGATKVLVRDADGVVSEQVLSSGLPSGGTDGQVLTVQPDGSYAWETPAAGGVDELTAYGTAAPTVAGTVVGSEFYVTPLGTQADAANATEVYRWDGTQWVKYPSAATAATKTTTSIVAQYGNGSAHVNAQANAASTVADVLKLSDGTLVNNEDKITWTGHGLAIHNWYFLDATVPGGYTNVPPVDPNYIQRLFYVEDANTIKVNVQEAALGVTGGGGSSGANGNVGDIWSTAWNAPIGTELVVGDYLFRINPAAADHVQVRATGASFEIQAQCYQTLNTGPTAYVAGIAPLVTSAAWRDFNAAVDYSMLGHGERIYMIDRTNDRAFMIHSQRTTAGTTTLPNTFAQLIVNRLR